MRIAFHPRRGPSSFCGWLLALTLSPLAACAQSKPDRIEFNRDIRPILSNACFPCHGPDKAKRKADLRLDVGDEGFRDKQGASVLVAGNPNASPLYQRITAADAHDRMPPAGARQQPTSAQIDLIRRWIEQGGATQKHWAFLPVRRPAVPHTARSTSPWPRNPVDSFVLARLEEAGLKPSPEAGRSTLLRRLTFDLTGLPPTIAELDAFLNDDSPGAYEKVVERLLHSPRRGERLAVRWLDAARYADTSGYQSDGERIMWRWRDWVINALNRNMPFDRFTIEQLAGDLLPNATLEQKLATGFNRNHRGNAEGGIVPEEYAVEYVVDRVETTATVWMGLTLGCARCHDHKYDPIKQSEFYQFFAHFNNIPEKGRALKLGNSPPMIKAPTPAQASQLAQSDEDIAKTGAWLRSQESRIQAKQTAWERRVAGGKPMPWSPPGGRRLLDQAKSAAGDLEFVDGKPTPTACPAGPAFALEGRSHLRVADAGKFGFLDKFSLSAWFQARDDRGGTLLSRMADVDEGDGYQVELRGGRIQVNMTKRWLDDALRVATVDPVPAGTWRHLLVTYDGSRTAAGVCIYLDGRPSATKVLLDELNQSFDTKEPFRIGAGGGPDRRFSGAIGDVRIYGRALTPEEAQAASVHDNLEVLAGIPVSQRTSEQSMKLRLGFLATAAPADIREAASRLTELQARRMAYFESIPTSMVMQEMSPPKPTFILHRGEYDKPRERVSRGVPSCLPPMPPGKRNDRLGLARWLVDPEHPLTARVAVNRLWQMHFGVGLVKTVEDFGAQGEWPSHPELLDWLASEFVRSGWDMQAMQRLIVTSATYRQSSKWTPELSKQDPENRLLARGPRQRLSAEMVRDQALLVSGLLVERQGGPSVKPLQPAGLWKELTGTEEYQPDTGPALHRRSLYTFWKRTVPPPAMMTFDAAGREACSVRESRTNTPLQALALLNDTAYVEAAQFLARRTMREAGPDAPNRIAHAFRLVLSRHPTAEEARILEASWRRELGHYRADQQSARRLVQAGEEADKGLDVAELAAYTALANLLLNLDETITKE